MHVLYKITYLPHIGTNYPKYYIGSKYNYKGNYYGSVDSKQIYDYTNGLQLKDWWKLQKSNPENFKIEILQEFAEITALELVNRERELHIKYNVLSEEYFNHSIATKGFCSIKRGEISKKIISEKTKKYWNSPEGALKKLRLINRNTSVQSDIMKEKWKTPSDAMINMQRNGRPKGAKDLTKRSVRSSIKQVKHKNVVYKNAVEAAEYFNVHPVSIRRWCKENINNWSYV
jgi:hypothetical protein